MVSSRCAGKRNRGYCERVWAADFDEGVGGGVASHRTPSALSHTATPLPPPLFWFLMPLSVLSRIAPFHQLSPFQTLFFVTFSLKLAYYILLTMVLFILFFYYGDFLFLVSFCSLFIYCSLKILLSTFMYPVIILCLVSVNYNLFSFLCIIFV